MGIWEKMPEQSLAALDREFGITSPRRHGTVAAIRAMRATVGWRLHGHGRLASATPTPPSPRRPCTSSALTVQSLDQAQPRSHLVHGATAADAGSDRSRYPQWSQTIGVG